MITLDPETSRRVFEISRSVWFWYNSIKDMSNHDVCGIKIACLQLLCLSLASPTARS